jgi:hypothetical protein
MMGANGFIYCQGRMRLEGAKEGNDYLRALVVRTVGRVRPLVRAPPRWVRTRGKRHGRVGPGKDSRCGRVGPGADSSCGHGCG